MPTAVLLLQMFGPEAPPLPWDTDNQYSREHIELYYLSNAGQPLQQVSSSGCSGNMANLLRSVADTVGIGWLGFGTLLQWVAVHS